MTTNDSPSAGRLGEQAGPWRTLGSRLEYENAWITVTHHTVVTPRGSDGVYGTVHFKNLAIGILPVDDEGNTWLVGQYRYPLRRYSWEIPEGGGQLDVDPLTSARRELKEETGIEAAEWRLLLEADLSNSVTDEHAYIYLATGLSLGNASPEDTEELTLRKLPFDEAYAMVLNGQIMDVMSICAILRYRLLRLEGLA